MTGASGGVICTLVLWMAIYMIVHANRELKGQRLPEAL